MDGFTPGRSEMGGGTCESYEVWWEHYYSEHMSDDQKQFLVVASGDFRHSMRIKQEVGSHLSNMIQESELVKLEAPNGRVYPVEVSWELGVVVLRSGWNEFVNAHHIEENNSILFVHRGNSFFKVHVFNSAGHEKSLLCSTLPSGISGPVPPFAPCNHHVQNEQVVPNPGHVNSTDYDYTMLPGCCLTKAQDEKVLEIVHTTRSEIPLYVAPMSKSNVSLKNCYVYIPLRLVDSFSEELTLQGPWRTVCVGASKHNHDQIELKYGWNTFVDSHHIQENDLLIFRSKEKTRLEVRILDPNGHEKTSCFVTGNPSSNAQEMCDDSVQIVDPPPDTVIDLVSSDDDDDDIVGEGTREPCSMQKRVTRSCAKAQKMALTSSPSTKPGYKTNKPHDRASVKLGVSSEPLSKNLGGPSQRPYILSQRTTLPWQVEKIIEEKVLALRSEVPIFVKVMTISSVLDACSSVSVMVFSVEYASAFLPDESKTLFLQLEGKKMQWQTTMEVRCDKMRYIYRGWREFAQQNGLEVGDICLFQLASRNTMSLTMTVHLIRKSEIEL